MHFALGCVPARPARINWLPPEARMKTAADSTTTASGAQTAPDHRPVRAAGLDHVVLRVADLERSAAFYRDVLGCAVEKWQPELGLLQLRAGSALIDLVPLDGKLGREGGAGPGVEGHNLDHFCVRLESFDEAALRAHLAAHGVEAGE